MMLEQEEQGDAESDSLLGQLRKEVSAKARGIKGIINVLLVFSVSLNILILGVEFGYKRPQSYEYGFDSDLDSVKSKIELTQYHFTGGVKITENGDFDMEQTTPKYIGSPSREIDEAWAHLLSGLNMDLEGHEADHLHGRTFQWPDSGHYFTGLEVFHSLHCLNRLRQALYPNYYNVFNDPNDPPREHHIGHCINHLRQAIQCHADLTPMEWTLTGDKLILRTDTMHSCRNFEAIHDWAIKRRSDYDEKELVVNGSIFIVD